MKNNRFKGIIALVIVTIVSFALIIVSKLLVNDENADKNNDPISGLNIDVGQEDYIKSARKLTDNQGNVTGYVVTAEAKGFVGPISWDVTFDKDAKTITDVSVVSHTESQGYGSKMEDDNFLSQFKGQEAPIYLQGNGPTNNENQSEETGGTGSGLVDGVYSVQDEEVSGDYRNLLTLKVEGGAITSLIWDNKDESGEYKSYLSSVGKYVMTEDGLTWKEQADALAEAVLADQSTEGIILDEDGKTDSVAGVSIDINGFINLTEKALELAAKGEGGLKTDSDNLLVDSDLATEIDGISGATVTSDAIVELVNRAYNFISQYVGG